jgi:hypothetical protein
MELEREKVAPECASENCASEKDLLKFASALLFGSLANCGKLACGVGQRAWCSPPQNPTTLFYPKCVLYPSPKGVAAELLGLVGQRHIEAFRKLFFAGVPPLRNGFKRFDDDSFRRIDRPAKEVRCKVCHDAPFFCRGCLAMSHHRRTCPNVDDILPRETGPKPADEKGNISALPTAVSVEFIKHKKERRVIIHRCF